MCMVGRKFVEHNMGAARHTKREEQFCRAAATIGPPIEAAAFLHRAVADLLIESDVPASIRRLKTQPAVPEVALIYRVACLGHGTEHLPC